MPPQVELIPEVGLTGDTPDVSGLTPIDCSCVAPKGMWTDGTGAPRPTPSGDVMLTDGSPGVLCATAEPQPRRSPVRAAIPMRVIACLLPNKLWSLVVITM